MLGINKIWPLCSYVIEDQLSMYELTDLDAHGDNNNSFEERVDEPTEFINSV
jgi:hypothetical protein